MAAFVPTHIETNNNKSGVGSIQVNAPIIGGTSAQEAAQTRVRNELLAKIGPPSVEPRFIPGTCKWILNDDKFQSWRESSHQHLLWISGRPGKGKSHIAAFLGEELSHRTRESSSSPLVLKFACKSTDIRRSTSLAVHLNVLHQILRFRKSDVALHDDAASILNDTHTSLNTNLPRDDLWGIIKGFVNRETGRSNKTFLWVSLALKLLKSYRSELEAIVTGRGQDALDRLLPVGLPSIYNRMLLEALRGKYDTQGRFDAKSCAKIIQFICVAFRPLTLAEMQVAADTSSDVSTIISNCRHILVESKEEAAQEDAGRKFEDEVSWAKSSPEAKHHRYQQEAEDSTEKKADEKTFQLVHLSLKQYLQQPPQLTIPTPLGLLLWSPLSLTVDTLRIMTHRCYYLDHILFMAILLSLSGLFKRYPATGLVLVALLAPQLSRRWRQKRSWVLQTLLGAFESLLGRCLYGIFAASERRSHRELFLRSVAFLMDKKDGLQREKDGNLSRPGALSARKPMSVDAELAPFGQYACRFWVDHLFSLNGVDWTQQEEALYGKWVLQFLESHLLDWLRNLSLQTKLRDGIVSMKRLIQIFENRDAEARQLELLLKDTERFMMRFAPIIERAPFQIYAAALAFCPNNSIVRSTYWDRILPWAEKIKTTQDDWSSVLQVLEGHTSLVISVAFSNDGKLIASASFDRTIRLWDAETGKIKGTLTIGYGHPGCVVFSRHGNLVASSMKEPRCAAIEIWDRHTGNLVNSIKTSCDVIHTITCSPDSDVLAAANDENSIQLWDLGTCSFLREIAYEGASSITSMTFYPDGNLVALTLGRIKTWVIETGQSKCMIKPSIESDFHTDDQHWCRERMAQLDSLALSVNGQITGQGPDHHKVHRGTSKTGKFHAVPSQLIRGRMAFSADRTMVASAHGSLNDIRLLDLTKSSSPPEQLLVYRRERIVQIWDTATGQVLTRLSIHESDETGISALTLSLDHSLLILSNFSAALQVWNLNDNTMKETYQFTRPFFNLALSGCGAYLRTNQGVIELGHSGSQREIYVDGEWIVRGQERVLWLPPDMWANHAVLVNDLLILSCISGDVKLVQF